MLFGYDLHAALHEVLYVHQQRTDRFTGSLGRQCHEQIDVAGCVGLAPSHGAEHAPSVCRRADQDGRLPIDTPDTSGLSCVPHPCIAIADSADPPTPGCRHDMPLSMMAYQRRARRGLPAAAAGREVILNGRIDEILELMWDKRYFVMRGTPPDRQDFRPADAARPCGLHCYTMQEPMERRAPC